MKKKLFLIFGPLVLAAVLLAVVLVTPFNFTKPDSEEIHEASLSQSNNIFKGTFISGYKFLYSSKFHIHVIFYTKKVIG